MVEENGFTFACPWCGQRFEVEYDMIGMTFDCPSCDKPFKVPEIGKPREKGVLRESGKLNQLSCQATQTMINPVRPNSPTITVIRKRERLIDRLKKRVKAIGIGATVLVLFVGVGVIKESLDEVASTATEKSRTKTIGEAKVKVVMTSIECLLNYVEMPNDRRLRALSTSLEDCPEDFKDAVKEFLISAARTSDDMISAKEREDMIKGKLALGLIFGAANQNDPQSGVMAGLQLGDLINAETKEKANRRLKQEVESKLNHLLDVVQKYGVDPNKLETALLSRMQ